MSSATDNLIRVSGGFSAAVRATMAFSRGLWWLCSKELPTPAHKNFYRKVEQSTLAPLVARAAGRDAPDLFMAVLRRVLEAKIGWTEAGEQLVFRRSVLNPLDFARTVLRDTRPDHELRFFVMQDIRRRYGLAQSSHAAHVLHRAARAMNSHLLAHAADRTPRSSITVKLHDEVLPVLAAAIGQQLDGRFSMDELFLECCRALKYLHLSDKFGHVEFRTNYIDAEYILSRLFGLPTSIKGLDQLFGGGGLMLVEAAEDPGGQRIGGRAILTMGPSGTGKSLLTLQMAVEVARKGGAAWVMPLEQTAEDCLYTLESMGALDDAAPLRVASNVPKAIELLEQPDGENGALILLRTVKDNFDDFLVIFEENVRLMRRYPLRLIAVDPVSAMTQIDADTTKRRAKLLQMFENVKQMGTNIWLVAEENAYTREPLYEHNIADTVIHLDIQNQHGYAQRYVEITKSRLQREMRGRHAFGLGPGAGMTVYPSSAAVKSMIERRANRVPENRTRFGIPSVDDVLGPKEPGLYAGDIVGVEGPSGCSKTPLGMMFLLSRDLGDSDHAGRERSLPRALFVSTRHSEGAVRHLLAKVYDLRRLMAPAAKQIPEIIVVTVEGGYVKPGYILQRIEDEFVKARLNDYSIGRVMIDNVGHWEFAPYVRADEIFGETLLDLLRAHRVTGLINCGDPRPGADSPLRRSIVEGVDCLIQCERVEFKGSSRVMLRVLKTRDMGHRREYFELHTSPHALDLKVASPLLRVGRNGSISPIPIRLFLHDESEAQRAYNATIVASIQSVLSREVEIEPRMLHLGKALGLGSASAIDELQVVQLDEFQLPEEHDSRADGSRPLYGFPVKSFEEGKWADTLPRLRFSVFGGDSVAAVPYFVNVGLLASRGDVDPECRTSWERLALECQSWERKHGSELFFDFWDETEENLNCVFLEILLSLTGPPVGRDGGPHLSSTCLREWITSDMAVTAMVLMHRLCSRAYHLRRAAGRQLGDQRTNPNLRPCVWRQWYTTLNQTLSEMPADMRSSITITPLPGGVSVAGEWYLGVPAYAAAPDVGLRIIQLFTRPDAELERFRLGVGLPTRVGFYALHESSMVGVSPYFTMDGSTLRNVVEKAFPRSTFRCYSDVNAILSSHLQGVLELPHEERTLATEIARHCDGLRRRLESNGAGSCSSCASVSVAGRRPTDRRSGASVVNEQHFA